MFWKKWDPWSFLLRRVARKQGFIDPITVLSKLQGFAKPSEVWVPTELLRSGVILQARGLMNSQAIQHNLDWIWPYWVWRQFNPKDEAFIPRAFSVTHINLTHRNWTAVGIPGFPEFPIVDPRGLVTPHYDGWSIDAWIVRENEASLIPSRVPKVHQELLIQNNLEIKTFSELTGAAILSEAQVYLQKGEPTCQVSFKAASDSDAWLAISIRPFNPEGVSFIDTLRLLPAKDGWMVNDKDPVHLDCMPSRYVFSNYSEGDVYQNILNRRFDRHEINCDAGMATGAALYEIQAGKSTQVNLRIPLKKTQKVRAQTPALDSWHDSLKNCSRLQIPDKHFQYLYETALSTFVLHSPGDVFPGPFTYKRFWFRDAAFILHAMLCSGMESRVEKVLDYFPARQTVLGYFQSQDGEWDSNGQAIWIFERFCRLLNQAPKPAWIHAVRQGAHWIKRKRISSKEKTPHAGLLPAGFSAEHLGPNDFYYWDDFWGIGGLRAAAGLLELAHEDKQAVELKKEADDFLNALEESLKKVLKKPESSAIPASPYRRLDAGAIGSLASGYPLQLWKADDKRLLATADYLVRQHFLHGGFYQEISHSGVNAYLSLHIAQVLLRAGDKRFMDIMKAIAAMATPTGQWPEAIHPRTGGGCMGDGQHVWAAAEWALLVRALFVREEESENLLVLGSGIPEEWLKAGQTLFFGPTPTPFGKISVHIDCKDKAYISWQAQWHGAAPRIEIPEGWIAA